MAVSAQLLNPNGRFFESMLYVRRGMLMAEQLAPGHFCIIDFSVDASSGSRTHFRRDPQAHQKTLDEFFQRTGRDFQRFNYLGEWHSHPSFSVRPSLEDSVTMTDIVDSGHSAITFAVLMIVRLRWWFWVDYSLSVFAKGQAPQPIKFSQRIIPRALMPGRQSQELQ
jgi:integrative and conjugative element protein (TIGR02256 family)